MVHGILRRLVMAAVAGVVASQPWPASASAPGRVDLNIGYDEPAVAAGGTGVQTFTVTNSGDDATGVIDLTITTPVFVTAVELPRQCTVLFRDAAADDTVPEIISCTVYPLAHDESASVPLTESVGADAAPGVTYGEVTVLPGPGSSDVDQHLADNLGWPSVVVTQTPPTRTGPSAGHVTDVYLTTDLPAVAVGAPASATLTVGNRGPQATTGQVRLLMVTPPLARAATPLPDGCDFRYDTTNVGTPQVIGCAVPAPIPSGAVRTVAIGLVALSGSPVQTSWGLADAFPDRSGGSTDVDPVPANNVIQTGMQVVG